MPKLFQGRYRTDSFRLKHYDYVWPGAYFVTIVTEDRRHYFGKIENEKMRLNKLAQIAEKCWRAIPQHFPFVILDYFCVMPNHVHGIVIIDNDDTVYTGTINCIRRAIRKNIACMIRRGVACNASTDTANTNHVLKNTKMSKISPKYGSLSTVIRSFKSAVAREIRKFQPDFAWQPLFHDRIIRTEREFHDIQQYIFDNPRNWGRDKNGSTPKVVEMRK